MTQQTRPAHLQTDEAIPALSDHLSLPVVCGTADLTGFAYQGHDPVSIIERIDRLCRARNPPEARDAASTYDTAIALQLAFRRAEALELLDAALEACPLYRIGSAHSAKTRVLAIMGPGDLMANAPLDFLTATQTIRLDLLFVLADRPLPPVIPEHDVAFFAFSEPDADSLERLRRLYARWPRPVLNDPGFLPGLERQTLSHSLQGVPGICSPAIVATSRTALQTQVFAGRAIEQDGVSIPYPCLIRPAGSHAGAGLERVRDHLELEAYLRLSFEKHFYISAFEDYAGADGLFRKYRVAFIDRRPFLCHLAISGHWMVHYLNAGMTESAEKRAEEARAMADFEAGFARRHAAAFDALHERLPFDYYSIDCAETRDGRLLVFEADTAAIVHAMDPPDLFPYKQPQMRNVFDAFGTMLRKHAASSYLQFT